MYRQSTKLKIAWFLLIFMITGTISFAFHSHQEIEWNENHLTDNNETETSISADTDYCPVCLFLLKTDLFETSHDGAVFNSSQQIPISVATTYFTAFQFIVKGRSPPTVI